MRILLPVIVAAALLAVPASAEVFTGGARLHLSLGRGTLSTQLAGDVHVSAYGISTKNGIKRASRSGDFQQEEVTVLGEPYDLKDAAGGTWRMWVRAADGKAIDVELLRARPVGPLTDRVFQAAAVTIDGTPTEATMDPLTLYADGTYALGRWFGKYRMDEVGVVLDGVAGKWGRGAYSFNDDGLVFRYSRGMLVFELRYKEQQKVAEK